MMNLLFIQTDQLSATALSHAGCPYVSTPNIDRLAARSVRFRNAFCAYPKCVPSRTSWMYGRMPHELLLPGTELDYGARPGDPRRGVRPEFAQEELGHWFTRHGHDCVFAGKWHVGQWGPTESLEPRFGSGFRALCPINDPLVPDACADFFRRRDPARPFLLVASFDNPHNICEYATDEALPWGPLPPVPGPQGLPPFPPNGYAHPEEPAAIRQRQHAVAEQTDFSTWDWRRYRWAYYRLVERLDHEVGRLLEALAASGLGESTAILFSSDHGDMQGAHLLTQKDTFYDESVKVPLLLALPGASRQGEDASLVNNGLDTFPTLCELAGIPPPPRLAGRSLVSAAVGPAFVAAEVKFRHGGGEARMIRSSRFKYVAYDLGPHREQLFDVERDPGEMENLATCDRHRAELIHHRSLLREWLHRTGDPFGRTHYAHPGKRDAIPGDGWQSV